MTDDDPTERIEAALGEVRAECWKATLVYAFVDAGAAFLGLNLLLAALDPGALQWSVALPAAVGDPLAGTAGLQTPVGVPGSAVVAGVAGVFAAALELWLRLRRPLIEQFEAVNPVVAESLRTARDAVDDGADSAMAVRLYEDVLEGLGESSGVALVDAKRVLAPGALIVVLALATPQAAVVDATLLGGSVQEPNATGGLNDTYTGLRDGDQVLGDSESVSAGDDDLTAEVGSSGAGREVDDRPQFPETGGSGASGGVGGVDSQQAGFAAPERVEEAELVREYNRRIREETTE